MSLSLEQRPAESGAVDGNGGVAARRAVIRWAWRLFRREWRQQVLVMSLLAVAVASTILATAVATNTPSSPAMTFGTANHLLTLPGTDPHLAADIAATQGRFRSIDVIEDQTIVVPGSTNTLVLRAQDPTGPYGHPTLDLLTGRFPQGPDEVAVTRGLAGHRSAWRSAGSSPSADAGANGHRRVVGVVEDPQDLTDEFALVAPGQIRAPTQVTILFDASGRTAFPLPGGAHLESRPGSRAGLTPSIIVLILATFGLLFIGLVALAGFTVMAQRRLRALGMVSALGATDRNVRLVMLANGAIVGVAATLIGALVGLLGWIAYAPRLQASAAHNVDRLNLPWWTIGTAMAMAVATAIAASWWPARAVARVPIVAALSGRPVPPKPARRSGIRGVILLALGLLALALADPKQGRASPILLLVGFVASSIGGLLLAPLAIRGLVGVSRRVPVAARIALRDLARYRARSAAALSAISLAVTIAVLICVGASARYSSVLDPTGPNLPTNQLILFVGCSSQNACPASPPSGARSQALLAGVAAALGTRHVLALDSAENPRGANLPSPAGGPPGNPSATLSQQAVENNNYSAQLYVATPALLRFYGIAPRQIKPTSDILTSRPGLAGLPHMQLWFGNPPLPGPGPTPALLASPGCPAKSCLANPAIQSISRLPTGRSEPATVITEHALRTVGLTTVPNGWLLQTARPLTATQIDTARQLAATAGASVESRNSAPTLSQLTSWATTAAILLALGVLAMTVGLIRSETADDLRILAAAGASSSTRRTITAVTAAALGLLGAFLGTAIAYLAALAVYRHKLDSIGHTPVVDLIVILVGLPLSATVAGWLLAGREPPSMTRQRLE